MKKFLHTLLIPISLCFALPSFAQPNISVAPASFSVTIANCNDSLTLPLVISNTGSAPLTYNLYDHQTTFMKLYAGNEDIDNISEFDMNTNTFAGGTIPSGDSPWRLCLSPKGDKLYASNRYSSEVYVYNTADNSLITVIPVGTFPSGLCVTPDGRFCFVTNRDGNSVSKINCTTNTVVSTITSNVNGPMDAAVTPDGAKLYITNKNSGTVTVYNANTDAFITSIAGFNNPHDIVIHPDGRFAYVGEAEFSTGNVFVINTTTNSIVTSIGTFDQVHGLDITPDGKFIYALDKWNSWVQVIQTSTNAVIDTIIDGQFNNGWDLVISPKGDYAYVTNKWNIPNFIILDLSNNTVLSSTNTSGGSNSYPAGLASLNSWATWMNESNQSGTIAASNSYTVNVEFNALGLSDGVYTGVIYVNSNAPSNPNIAVPCTMTVVGTPNINIPLANSCPKFDTIMVNASDVDTFDIQNLKCGTLNITNVTTSNTTDFTIISYPASVPGFSTGQLVVQFNPTTTGNKTTTITVQNSDADTAFCLQGFSTPAPTIGVTPTSLIATINSCNDSITLPLTINNTGAGLMNYTIDLGPSSSGANFYDGFESGNFASWNIGSGTYSTRTVTTSNPADGLYSFQLVGGNGVNYDGINHTFPSSTPNYVSYKFMSPVGSTGWNCGVQVGRTSDIISNSGIADSWIDNSSMVIYLQTAFQTFNVAMVQGQWYTIEYRNINYSTKTFDYYINGTFFANFTFLNQNITNVDVIHLMGWDPGHTSYYDEILIGNDPSPWLFPSPLSGTSAPFGSSVVNVKMKSSNVVNGTYYGNILVNSNDPLTPLVQIPCTLTVNGVANINIPLPNSCPLMDSIMVGQFDQDTFLVENLGCDTLFISNVSSSSSHFIVDTFPAVIPPYSSYVILITFQPTSAATHATTILVQNSDGDTSFCLQGIAIPAPIITVDPTFFNVSVACGDSLTDTLTIHNIGGSDLFCQIAGGGSQQIKVMLAGADYANYYTDVQSKLMSTGKFSVVDIFDARNGTPTLAQLQAYDAVLTWTDYSYSNATLLGNNLADYVDGGGGVVAAIFTTGNFSPIGGRFTSQNYWCITPSGYNYGGANQTLGTVYNPAHPIMDNVVSLTGNSRPSSNAIMAGAVKIADWSDGRPLIVTKDMNGNKRVDLGMWPPSNDVTGGNSWVTATNGALIMANALHYSANNGVPWMTLSPPAADTIVPGDSTQIAVEFNSTGISAGTYTTVITVTSNDPANPIVTVPVTFTVVGTPDMSASLFDVVAPSCLDLDSIMAMTTSIDSIAVSNAGCDTLRIDSLIFSPSIFSLISAPTKVAPGQTKNIVVLFSPTVAGTFPGTLNIYTNELDTVICLQGKAFPNPVICWNPDSFNVNVPCGDSLTLPLIICNSGGGDLIWDIQGAGNGGAQINAALVAAQSNAAWRADVQAKLMATGKFSSITVYDASAMTPTLAQLMLHDAVLVWRDNGFADATLIGNNLADYVDAGGGVVTAIFSNTSSIILGRFNTSNYWCVSPNAGQTTGMSTLGTVYDPAHPIMDNITSFNGGSQSWRPNTFSVVGGATKVADWADGRPLVVTRVINGSFRVDLGMFPPSNTVYGSGWQAATDGAMLMANALVWSKNGGASWMNVSPTADTTYPAPNDTTIVNVEFNASTLNVGQYTGTLTINSNDPLTPVIQIPCTMNVVGAGNFLYAGMSDIIAPNCLDLDSIMEFTTSTDSIFFANNGCDTLFVDSIICSPSEFTTTLFTNYILPGDTGGVIIQFAPTSVGNFSGTANVYTNDLDTVFCLKGESFPRPVMSVDPDTFNITLTCADTLIDTLTIYNAGLTDLIYNIDTSDYSAVFDGSGDVIYRGAPTTLPTGNTPLTVEAWIYPQGYNDGTYNGIVSWGNRGCTGNGFLLSIQSNGRPSMALWCNDFVPSSGPTATLNQWNHIACVLNGTSVTLYMNGVPISGTITNTQGFTSTNLAIGCTDWWGRFFTGRIDEVRIWNKARTTAEILSTMNVELTGNEANLVSYYNFDNINANDLGGPNNCLLTGNVNFQSDNAANFYSLNGNLNDTIVTGDSSQIAVTVISTGLTVGNYYDSILVFSNDPLNNPITVPINLTVVGAPDFKLEALFDTIAPLCLDLDSIIEFTTSTDSIGITNLGCDTLWLDSLVFAPAEFSLVANDPYILPGDTGGIVVMFSPLAPGPYTGTLNVYTNDLDTILCLKGYANPRPIICHSPDTFNITINICQDTVIDQLLICNSGGSDLYWDISVQSSITDDFDPTIDNSVWSFNNGFTSLNCGSMSGNALYFNDNGVRRAETYDLNATTGGNISFAIKLGSGGSCEYLDGGEEVYLEYSVSGTGGPWINMATYFSGTYVSFTPVSYVIPAGAQTANTRFRWRQPNHSGACCDHWAIDDVSINVTSSSSVNIIAVPNPDTTAAGDTTYVTMFFTDSGLTAGTYTIPFYINSNDPLNPQDTVIVILTIDSLPSNPPVANDTNVCFGNPTPDLIAVPVNSSDTVKWYDFAWVQISTGDTLVTGQTAMGTYTYYVTATDTSTGCESQADTVLLSINGAPSEPTSADASSCFGQAVPSLTSSGTINQWYTSSPPTTPVFTGNPYNTGLTAAGTYTFFVTDSTGACPESSADTVMLTIYSLPNTPLALDTAVCVGGPIPPLTATVTGTDSIRWYNTAMIFQASGDTFNHGQSAAGTYTYYVTSVDTVTFCESVRDTSVLTINSTPLPNANNVSSCFGSPTPPLVATPNNSIQWYDDVMSPLAANDTLITGQTAVGTYTYYVTQTLNGCESNPRMVTLTINPIPSVPVAPDVSSCFGSPTPPLTATGTSIKWYSDAALTSLVALGSPYNTGLTAVGSYTYYVTQTAAGCPSLSDTVYLNIYALPVTPIATNTVVCFGNPTPDLIATNITGSDTVEWYSSVTLTPVIYTGNPYATGQVAVGTYTYYVTQTDTVTGCRSAADVVTLSINSAPLEPTANDMTACSGGVIPSLTSTGTLNQWYNSSPITTPVFTGNPYATGQTAVGTYTYYVTDSVPGCPESPEDTATLTINQTPAAPVSVPQKDSICFGSPNPAFAAAGTNIQWWSNPSTTTLVFAGSPFTPTVTATGTYSYYVTETVLGCKSPSDSITFKINPVPAVALGADVTQCGGTVNLNAGNPGASYLWSTTATTQSIVVSVSGTYSVQVTNAGGCTGTDIVNITINPIPSAVVSVPQYDSICFGDPNPTFNAAGTTVEWWSNPTLTTLIASGTAFTPTVTAAGTYTYYVTQSALGCKSPSDTVKLTISFTPALAVNDTATSFGTPPVVLSASGTNVQWYDISMNPLFSGSSYNTGQTAVGTYTYIVTQTLNNCESANDTMVLTIYPGAPVGTSATACFGQPIADLTATGSGIQWWSNSALTILAGTGSPFATGQTAVGTYTYYVTQTINFVQSPSDTVTLTINALPSAPASADQSACFGSAIPDLTATGTSIQWYDNLMNPAGTGSPFATGQTAAGTYTYYVTQTNTVTTCESNATMVTLTINALPTTPVASNDTTICYGDPNPAFTATGTNITWYDDAMIPVGAGSPYTPVVTAPGTYTFIATQTNTVTTCESMGDTVLFTINSIAPPIAPDVAVCFGNPVPDLTATGTMIQWFDNLMNPVFSGSPFATGQTAVGTYTYYVSQTNTVTTCSSPVDTVYLTISSQPTLAPTVSDTDACFGSVIPDLNSTTGTIINWYSDAALTNLVFSGNPFASGMTAIGSYTFFATDSTPGCPEGPSDPAVLVINALPATLAVNDTASCFGSATPDLIAAGNNITWYNTVPAIVSTNDTFATGQTAVGTYTYYVTQTNTVTTCASIPDTVMLTINALPATPSALDTAVCSAATIPNLTSTGTNVQWYNSAWTFVFTGSSYSTGMTAAGSYTYYVTQKDLTTGCESVADTAILTIMLSPPIPTANNQAVCFGNPVPPLSSTGTNVMWYSDAALTTLVNTGNTYNTGQTAVGVYTYWVTDSLTGCVSSTSDSATLTINNLPAKPTANNTTICYGGAATLTSTGTNPQWYSDATLINNVGSGSPFNTGLTAVGTYTYYVADYAAGCGNSVSDTATLTINPVPLVTANTYSVVIVQGNSTTLTAYNANTYVWSPTTGLNTTTGATVVASPTVTTTYTVTGTNSFGCTSSVSIVVSVNPLGVAAYNEPLQDVNIYPNPAIDAFTLEFNSTLETPIDIYMVNMLGAKVRVMKSEALHGGGLMKHKYRIDTSTLTEGVYNIEIVTDKGIVNRRVVLFR